MTASLTAGRRTGTTPGRRLLGLLCAAQFMLVLDITVVNVALPEIGSGLALGRDALTWTVTAYTLCFGGLMLLGGRLADTLGTRRIMLTGLAVFTLASLGASLASGAVELVAARVAQGIGAALVSPAALAVLTTTFEGPARHRALGVWSALGGAGFAAGALVGGALTSGPGWRWIFLVNVPVGLALLALLPFVLPTPDGGGPLRRGRLDVAGAVLVTLATGSTIYALVHAGDAGWSDPTTLGSLAGAVALYATFGYVERHVRTPLMHVAMLTRRPVMAGAVLMLVASALMVGAFFVGSLYLQHARSYGPMRTGLVFLPAAIAVVLGAHVAGRLIGRVGPRPIAVTGLGLAALGAALAAAVPADAGIQASVLPGMTLLALGVGPVFVTATTTAMGFVDPAEAGLASGLINTFHELGGAFGVAGLSTVAATAVSVLSADGFRDAYVACAVAAAVTAALAAVLVPPGRPSVKAGPHAH